jgi:hypothetical protein
MGEAMKGDATTLGAAAAKFTLLKIACCRCERCASGVGCASTYYVRERPALTPRRVQHYMGGARIVSAARKADTVTGLPPRSFLTVRALTERTHAPAIPIRPGCLTIRKPLPRRPTTSATCAPVASG